MRLLRALWNFLTRRSSRNSLLATTSTTNEALAPSVSWTEVGPAQELIPTLAAEAERARGAGRTPVVFLHAPWCRPSAVVKKTRSQPLMRDAFASVHVIEVNIDSLLALQLEDAGLAHSVLPAFCRLDEQGRATDAWIDGSAWGKDTPENMAPPLCEFFGQAQSPSRDITAP